MFGNFTSALHKSTGSTPFSNGKFEERKRKKKERKKKKERRRKEKDTHGQSINSNRPTKRWISYSVTQLNGPLIEETVDDLICRSIYQTVEHSNWRRATKRAPSVLWGQNGLGVYYGRQNGLRVYYGRQNGLRVYYGRQNGLRVYYGDKTGFVCTMGTKRASSVLWATKRADGDKWSCRSSIFRYSRTLILTTHVLQSC